MRTQTITQKTETNFGQIYVHVDYAAGKVTGVSFSQPGKLGNSTIGTALDTLANSVNEIIAEIRQ